LFEIYRQKGQKPSGFDKFKIQVNPNEYILDAIERIWAYHDRSLTFAHACHHSTCGACGMRVNGKEKLTCITPIREVASDRGIVKVEPLRNFPVISDLVVDMGILFRRMETVGHSPVSSVFDEPFPKNQRSDKKFLQNYLRLSDCIECGLCISACPVAITSSEYLGPAALAGAQQHGLDDDERRFDLLDSDVGVWRCHSAFECTSVCPSHVEPAWRIMELRKLIIKKKIKRLFR